MATPDTDAFLVKGKELSKLRDDAFASYSQIADLVRDRLKELEAANRDGQRVAAKLEQLERALSVAERLKELAVLELQHADDIWREWREEARARADDDRITRQEKTTTSATVAAWAAAIAAIASTFLTIWQVFHLPHVP